MSKPKHHVRQQICATRAPYRDGRKPTAVKVYTIHHESKYLLIQGVPSVGASNELLKLFGSVGEFEEHKILDDYPGDQFTEVHRIKYKKIQSARFAKRKFDDWSFYGGVLHVCYAPEFETIQETREKLRERRRVVEAKTRQYKSDGTYSSGTLPSPSSSSNHVNKLARPQQEVAAIPYIDEDTVQVTNNETESHANRSSNVQSQYNQSNEILHNEENRQFSVASNMSQMHRNERISGSVPSYSPVLDYTQLPHTQTENYHISSENYGGHIPQTLCVSHNQTPSYNDQVPFNQTSGYPDHVQTSNNKEQIQNNQGSGYLYSEKVHKNRNSSYAEQIVAQARSLQNYGKMNNASSKRTHTDSFTDNDHSREQVVSIETANSENEEKLILPPPPKQTKFSHTGVKPVQKYGGRRVPSAQATFPEGFDARTDRVQNLTGSKSVVKESDDEDTSVNERNSESGIEQRIADDKTMQEKVEANLQNKSVVIKEISKKGTVPKFIPRQAQNKMKMKNNSEGKKGYAVTSKNDELSEQIKKNALKLGKSQGPADLGPTMSNESLDPKEKSVMDSVQEIRKKLMKKVG